MNKKLLMTGAAIFVGGVLLVSTAFAGMNETTGYEAYKSAVKNSAHTVKNFTGNFDVSVKDNGNPVAEISSLVKTVHDGKYASSMEVTAKAGGQEKKATVYQQDGKSIVKAENSEIYNVTERDQKRRERADRESAEFRKECDPEDLKAGEMIVDALVGNLKNYFSSVEKADGSKDVAFNLSGPQIPAVVNAIASAGIKEAGRDQHKPHIHTAQLKEYDMDIELPSLVEDIKVDSVDFTAAINKDNIIESQNVNMAVTGKDAGGKEHTLVFSMKMNFSNFNTTTPDTVDLTGKQVKVVKPEEFKHK